MHRVLTIAGSDSGAGAGIQGDIKAISAFGCYATTAITAITAQNTRGVQYILPLTPHIIRQQIISVLDDIGADVIKIGMLVNSEIINIVADTLDKYAPNTPRIIDPVMISTSGDRLLDEDATQSLISRLINGCTLLTPNIIEAQILADCVIDNPAAMMHSAKYIKQSTGAKAILLKGGHLAGDNLIDIFISDDDCITLQSARIKTTSTHGTGCAYASAIAAQIANNVPLAGAIKSAHDYINSAIANASDIGHGNGPINHFYK